MRLIVLILALIPGILAHAQKAPDLTLVELLGSNEQTLQIHTELLNALIQTNPELAQHQAAVETWARKYLTQATIEKRLAAMYSQFFTDEELNELIDFYSSETGSKVILLVPTLMRETRQIGKALAEEHIEELEVILRSEE